MHQIYYLLFYYFLLSFSGNFGGDIELRMPHFPGDEIIHSTGWMRMLLYCLSSSSQEPKLRFQQPEMKPSHTKHVEGRLSAQIQS